MPPALLLALRVVVEAIAAVALEHLTKMGNLDTNKRDSKL